MPDPERALEAERPVPEAEERLTRQLVLIRRLKIAGRDCDADAARDLPTLSDTVRAARSYGRKLVTA
jgi:hypothetical protein